MKRKCTVGKAEEQPFRDGRPAAPSPVKPASSALHSKKRMRKKKSTPPWVRALMVPELRCPDCRGASNVLSDPKSGRQICTSCGLVLANQLISDESEWRTFANDDRGGPDPNRVGAAQHYLLAESGDLSTRIGGDGGRLGIAQMHLSRQSSSAKLTRGIREVSSVCARLSLPRDVQNFAGELLKELLGKSELRGKSLSVMTACTVYIAAKQCRCDRPLKELCAQLSVDRNAVRKVHTEVHKLKSADKLVMPVVRRGMGLKRKSTHEIFAERYAGQLKLPCEVIKAVRRIARGIEQKALCGGKHPSTVGAVCVYLASVVFGDEAQRRSLKEIAAVSRVSEGTIRSTFKKHVFLHRIALLPEGYGDAIRISNLVI